MSTDLMSVKMETKQFNKFVKKFVKQSSLATETIIRKMALDLLRRIIMKNPVDT